MLGELEWLKQRNGQGFLFSVNGGGKPVSRTEVSGNFYRAQGIHRCAERAAGAFGKLKIKSEE
jgi:hypothetical protein